MRFTTPRSPFLAALQILHGVVQPRNSVPILGNVVLSVEGDILTLQASDLDVGVKLRLQVFEAEDGTSTASAKALVELVRELPEATIKVQTNANQLLQLRCGRAKVQLMGLPSDQYPFVEFFKRGETVLVKKEILLDAIERTQFAVSQDQTRYQITGILLEIFENGDVRASGTDGHRLSLVEYKKALDWHKPTFRGIMPRKSVLELKKILEGIEGELQLSASPTHLYFESKDKIFFLRLLDGEYPDYRAIIPDQVSQQIRLDRVQFMAALKRANLITNERNKGVKMFFSKHLLRIEATNPELGQVVEELELHYTDAPLEVAFNCRYLFDAMQVMNTETVELCLSDPFAPVLIHETNQKAHLYILMPMRV
jgi:DNA polymerase III subunit beta